MSKNSAQTFAPILTSIGFAPDDRQSWTLWRQVGSEHGHHSKLQPKGSSVQQPLPWDIEAFELAQRRSGLSIHRLSAKLKSSLLLQRLEAGSKKFFGPRTSVEFAQGHTGETWCFFEFLRPGVRDRNAAQDKKRPVSDTPIPNGTGGFAFRIAATNARLEVIVSDYFAVGYVPANFVSLPIRYLADALGLRVLVGSLGYELQPESIYELTVPLSDIVFSTLLDNSEDCTEKKEPLSEAINAVREALSQSRATPGVMAVATEDGWRFDSSDMQEAIDLDVSVASLSHVPIEVLESRERSPEIQELDLLIFQGKLQKASELTAACLQTQPESLLYLRRLALLSLAGGNEFVFDVGTALHREPYNKLFLACSINAALERRDSPTILTTMSHLGAQLLKDVKDFDNLKAFDLVFPEILGDAWRLEDTRKAEDCYQRILQKRGDMPRILRKIVDLAHSSNNTETEITYLNRLSAVERRHIEQAKIFLRLAQLCVLQDSVDPTKAINLALRSLKYDRSQHEAAVLAANLLVTKGKSEEAIRLLDVFLRDAGSQLLHKDRANVEAMLGRIWLKLGRPDLAERRYEAALRHDQGHEEALREIEAIYRQFNRIEGLAQILERQFVVLEQAKDGDGQRQVFDELATLYRGSLARPQRAFDLYQKLAANGYATPEDVERVLLWNDVAIDWRAMYNHMHAQIENISSGRQRAQLRCRLAEICREKLGDEEAGLHHYIAALEDGWIESNGFQFITETLTRTRDYQRLTHCYDRRIQQVHDEEQRQLIAEFLALPIDALSPTRRDALSVQAFILDPSNEKILLQRFAYYRSHANSAGIEQVLTLILKLVDFSAYQRQHWIRHAIETLEGCRDPERFARLDGCWRLLVELSEDQVAICQEAMTSLWMAPDDRCLAFYAGQILNAGVLPDLDENKLLNLLRDLPRESAAYHRLMALKTIEPEAAAQHARAAAAFYMAQNEPQNVEPMLARLCSLVRSSDDDLAQLRRFVEVSGHWSLLAKALQRQVDIEPDGARRYALLEQLGAVYWHNLRDYGRARLTYVLATKLAPQPFKIKLTLAALARESSDSKQEKKALIDFLMDPQSIEDIKAMSASVQRLLQMGEEPAYLQRMLLPYIEQAAMLGQHDVAGQISNVLMDNDIASLEAYRLAFSAALAAKQDYKVIAAWWRGLACVANKSGAKVYVAETRLLLEQENRRDLLVQCFQAALDNHIGNRVGPKIKHEILILYGALLFDSDDHRRRALTVYQQARAEDPDDNRTWMPMYFLLLEFGSPRQRLLHLRDVVPKLMADSRPLKSFPITIESLQVELQDLERKHKGIVIEEATDSDLGADEPTRVPAVLVADEEPTAAVESSSFDVKVDEMSLGSELANAGEHALDTIKDTQKVDEAEVISSEASNDQAKSLFLDFSHGAVGSGTALPLVAGEPFELPDLPPVPKTPRTRKISLASLRDQNLNPAALKEPDDSESATPIRAGSYGPSFSLELASTSQADSKIVASPETDESPDLFLIENNRHLDTEENREEGVAETPSLVLDDIPAIDLELGGDAPEPGERAERPAQSMPGMFELGMIASDPKHAVDISIGGDIAASLSLDSEEPDFGEPESEEPDEASVELSLALDRGADDSDESVGTSMPALDLFSSEDKDIVQAATPSKASHQFRLEETQANLIQGQASGEPKLTLGDDPELARPAPGNFLFSSDDGDSQLSATISLSDAPQSMPLQPPMHSLADEGEFHGSSSDINKLSLSTDMPSAIQTGTGEGSSYSQQLGNGGFAAPLDISEDSTDWRLAVIKGDFNVDLTSKLLAQAFANELEKHVAIQAVGLVAGNCDRLSHWHWRVWRHANEYGYGLSGKERYPEEQSPGTLKSSLHKLVLAAAPVLVKVQRERFSLSYIARRLETTVDAIERLRRPLPWGEGLLADVGLRHFQQRIEDKHYKAFSLPGLAKNIFYEGSNRAFYIDDTYYRKAPPSHLFHRLLGLMWSIRLQYFIPLTLHPLKHVSPLLADMQQNLSTHGLSLIKSKLRSKSGVAKHLQGIDTQALKVLFEKVGLPTDDALNQLWNDMRLHVNRLLLAETLDVIGLFEALTDRDLLKPGALKHSEIYTLLPAAPNLIDFITKLKI